MNLKNKKTLLIRFFIGITLFALLFLFIGWKNTFTVLSKFNFSYLILILGIAFFMIAISCWKWQIFLTDRGLRVNIWKLISLYIIGYFFNSFLPGSISGDVVRSYILGKDIKSQVESLSSIFMERFTGLVALVSIGVIAAIINFHFLLQNPIILFLIALIFICFVFLVLVLLNKKLILWLTEKIRIKRIETIKQKLLQAYHIIYEYRFKKAILFKTLAISFVFHTMTSVNTWVVCRALGIQMNFLDILVFIPIILLASAIPISIGGLGIWEMGFSLLFVKAGITQPQAFSISLILRAKNYFVVLLGGVLFAFTLRRLSHGDSTNKSAIVPGN